MSSSNEHQWIYFWSSPVEQTHQMLFVLSYSLWNPKTCQFRCMYLSQLVSEPVYGTVTSLNIFITLNKSTCDSTPNPRARHHISWSLKQTCLTATAPNNTAFYLWKLYRPNLWNKARTMYLVKRLVGFTHLTCYKVMVEISPSLTVT